MFPSRDGNLAINVFGYVQQPGAPEDGFSHADGVLPEDTEAKKARRAAAVAAVVAADGSGDGRGPVSEAVVSSSELLEYAASIQAGEWTGDASHAAPDPMVNEKMSRGVEILVDSGRSLCWEAVRERQQ